MPLLAGSDGGPVAVLPDAAAAVSADGGRIRFWPQGGRPRSLPPCADLAALLRSASHRYPTVSRPSIQPKAPGCADLLMASWHARCRWRTTLLHPSRSARESTKSGTSQRSSDWTKATPNATVARVKPNLQRRTFNRPGGSGGKCDVRMNHVCPSQRRADSVPISTVPPSEPSASRKLVRDSVTPQS